MWWLAWSSGTPYGGRVDPLQIVLAMLVAAAISNGLWTAWNTLQSRPALLRAAVDACISQCREIRAAVEEIQARQAGDRIEHLRQVDELTNLVSDVERVRNSAATAVRRREAKETKRGQEGEQEETFGSAREASIAGARRYFAAVG